MSAFSKYMLSVALLVAGLALLLSSMDSESSDSPAFSDIAWITGEVEIPLSLPSGELIKQIEDSHSIQPLFFLETTVCTSCLNNVHDYQSMFSERERFGTPFVIFFEKDESAIKRFLHTTDTKLNYVLLDSTKVHPALVGEYTQHLMFWDASEEMVFYKENIPNVTTTLEYKSELLDRVDSLWVAQKAKRR
jgi:hypothetical protein